MKAFAGLGRWLLYWGSKDERIQAGADKAGHVAFQLLLVGVVVNWSIQVWAVGISPDTLRIIQTAVILFPCFVYGAIWVRLGITIVNSKKQSQAVAILIAFAFIISAALEWWASHDKEITSQRIVLALAFGLGGAVLAALVVLVTDRLARAQVKKREN